MGLLEGPRAGMASPSDVREPSLAERISILERNHAEQRGLTERVWHETYATQFMQQEAIEQLSEGTGIAIKQSLVRPPERDLP